MANDTRGDWIIDWVIESLINIDLYIYIPLYVVYCKIRLYDSGRARYNILRNVITDYDERKVLHSAFTIA